MPTRAQAKNNIEKKITGFFIFSMKNKEWSGKCDST